MKRRFYPLIVLLLCGFYALSALEVSVGDYTNEFGDCFDTYVPATSAAVSAAAAVSVNPALTPDLMAAFRSLLGHFPAQRPILLAFTAPLLSSRIRLHLRHSVWLI